jgi:hypothetical protein
MTRVKERAGRTEDPELPTDYFVIGGQHMEWYVSREMARHVEACLDQVPPVRWVTFVDLKGARVRLRARLITHVEQCTVEQRMLGRAFHRRERQERQADRDWDDDDDL